MDKRRDEGRPPAPEASRTSNAALAPLAPQRDEATPSRPEVVPGPAGPHDSSSGPKDLAPGPRDLPCLGLALLLALLWTACVDGLPLGLAPFFPCLGGVGVTLSLLCFLAIALVLGRGPRRLGRETAALVVVCALLSVAPSLTASTELRLLNSLVLGPCCVLTFLLLSGGAERIALSLRGCLVALAFFFGSQVRNAGRLRSLRPSLATRSLVSAGLGLLAGVVVLALVVPLLASADAVFMRLLEDSFLWMGEGWERWVWRAVRVAVVGTLSFSLLVAVADRQGSQVQGAPSVRRRDASALSVTVPLLMLDVVYAVFVIIQFAYLFGGAASTAAFGGYAAYARSGFFQLVVVAAINLAVVLASRWLRRDAKPARHVGVLQYLLLAATLVVLASAALRMSLYVGVYGLSLLRALTYLGMVAIAGLVALVGASIALPHLPTFRLSLAFLLALWCAFILSGPAARIASFNVDGYLSGSIEVIDIDYLGSLSPDARWAIARLAEESPACEDQARLELDALEHYWDGETWSTLTAAELLSGGR
ncbi:DUF4173 domain-containing protein [Olsenella sp. HMSC062G07]|uniref:DUF4153 domain-containing protein n=1 Tax=Olsenella sp. HMSC062G07 TaxID=1739330 RepID=UPI0008A2A708|nr:DUF4173 domain-containing protein [Olsenella sp. HMSC062G07]OFK24760.1 hypothetical protein HMPREF2826_05905 [Olsenella sp. HMSC062G07]